MGQRHYIDLVGSLGHRSLAVLLLLMCIYVMHYMDIIVPCGMIR